MRHFGFAFNPSQSPLTTLSPQSYSWRQPRSCNCPCNCTQITYSTQYTDIQYSTPVEDNIISSARKQNLEEDSNKENKSPGLSSPPKKWKYKKQRTTNQKPHDIFKVIHDADWGLSDFLYFVFQHKDTDGNEIHCEQAHANMVQKFLARNCVYMLAHILHLWYYSKDGRQEDPTLMFSTTKPYMEISAIHKYLTSFAAQIIEWQLVL